MGRTRSSQKGARNQAAGVFGDPEASGMLFDERLLTREQALSRFFTPLTGKEALKGTPERVYKTPNNSFALINPRSAFVAPQIRELYDPLRIERMGVNIRDGVDGQLQNGGVSFIDDEHIEEYLGDMNDYFETDISPDMLTRHHKFGCYIITAYGHNRQFAVASANLQTNGHPDRGILFFVKVFYNPEFWRILANQATENTGEPPPMWVRARSIVKFQEFRNRDKAYVTKDDIGRLFNVDRDQIWRAERYDALPNPIKALVMEEKLPYTGSFELDALLPIYGEDYVVMLAYRLAEAEAKGPQILDAVRRRLAASVLTPEIRSIIDQGHITFPQAQELVKLRDFMSDDGLNELASWICIARPDIDAIRSKVKRIIKDKESGNVDMFAEDSTSIEDPEKLRELVDSYRQGLIVSGIQGTVSEIARNLDGLLALVKAGLVGTAIDSKPIASGAPDHVTHVVESLAHVLNSKTQKNTTSDEAKALHLERVDDVIEDIARLLYTEQTETAETQRQRRLEIAQSIATIIKQPKPVQEGLF